MHTKAPPPLHLTFFALVFALSIPFVVLGAVTAILLMPGIPVSALAFVAPVTAATILVYRESRAAGVAALPSCITRWPT